MFQGILLNVQFRIFNSVELSLQFTKPGLQKYKKAIFIAIILITKGGQEVTKNVHNEQKSPEGTGEEAILLATQLRLIATLS